MIYTVNARLVDKTVFFLYNVIRVTKGTFKRYSNGTTTSVESHQAPFILNYKNWEHSLHTNQALIN